MFNAPRQLKIPRIRFRRLSDPHGNGSGMLCALTLRLAVRKSLASGVLATICALVFLSAVVFIGHHAELPFQRYAAALCKVKSTVVSPSKVKVRQPMPLPNVGVSVYNDHACPVFAGFCNRLQALVISPDLLYGLAGRAPPTRV